MSVITNFKNRQLQKAKKEQASVEEKLAKQSQAEAEENKALTLLAQLLNVSEENALTKAEELVEQRVHFVEVGIDLADGEDLSATAKVTLDEKGDITHIDDIETAIEYSTAELSSTADAVQSAASDVESSAESVNSAASSVEDSASDLAYTADDINAATEELKEATAEIKKPSVAPKSSSLKKTSKPKNSSKK